MTPLMGAISLGFSTSAAGRDRWRHLADDLIERPVPGRYQPDDADAFSHDTGVAALLFELEALEHLDRRFQVTDSGSGLGIACQVHRRTHLVRYGARDIVDTLVMFLQNSRQQPQALRLARLGKGGESCPRGSNGA